MRDQYTDRQLNPRFPILWKKIDLRRSGQEYFRDCCPNHTMLRILNGKATLHIGESRYHLAPGDIAFINARISYRLLPQSCMIEQLIFDIAPLLNRNNVCLPVIQQFNRGRLPLNVDAFCYHPEAGVLGNTPHSLATELFNILEIRPTGFELIAQGILIQLIGRVLPQEFDMTGEDPDETNAGGYPDNPELLKVLVMIEQNYDKDITLDKMAQTANMSPNYFCRFFKKEMKQSPIQYLIGYRLKAATAMLTDTDMTVLDISLACGFNNVSHFGSTFRKAYGCTPQEYRQQKNF